MNSPLYRVNEEIDQIDDLINDIKKLKQQEIDKKRALIKKVSNLSVQNFNIINLPKFNLLTLSNRNKYQKAIDSIVSDFLTIRNSEDFFNQIDLMDDLIKRKYLFKKNDLQKIEKLINKYIIENPIEFLEKFSDLEAVKLNDYHLAKLLWNYDFQLFLNDNNCPKSLKSHLKNLLKRDDFVLALKNEWLNKLDNDIFISNKNPIFFFNEIVDKLNTNDIELVKKHMLSNKKADKNVDNIKMIYAFINKNYNWKNYKSFISSSNYGILQKIDNLNLLNSSNDDYTNYQINKTYGKIFISLKSYLDNKDDSLLENNLNLIFNTMEQFKEDVNLQNLQKLSALNRFIEAKNIYKPIDILDLPLKSGKDFLKINLRNK